MQNSFYRLLKVVAIAAVLAVVIGICIQQIVKSNKDPNEGQTERLLLVNILTRHGDRSPASDLYSVDVHKNEIEQFWPNGLKNLTDVGRFRMFKLGLELRRLYKNYLGYDAKEILALSSPVYRCQESLNLTVRGLMNIEQAYDRRWKADMPKCSQGVKEHSREHHHHNQGQDAAASASAAAAVDSNGNQQCISTSGKGYGDEWQKVALDTQLVPLSWIQYDQCKFRQDHPSPVMADLLVDKNITSLPKFDKLVQILKRRYRLDKIDWRLLNVYTLIRNEIEMARTIESQNHTDHFSDWINEIVVNGSQQSPPITMLDVLEQVNVLVTRDGRAMHTLVESGPIVTSIIESQSMALGRDTVFGTQRMWPMRDKKMILYSTHDDILLKLLMDLGGVQSEGASFEQRWLKWAVRSATGERKRLDRFLNGLDWPNYAISLRFELVELQANQPTSGSKSSKSSNQTTKTSNNNNNNSNFAYVRLSIYNEPDARFAPVHYEPIQLGSVCRQAFARRHPKVDVKSLFYNTKLQFDHKFGCPFELFKNVTSHLIISEEQYQQLCNPTNTTTNSTISAPSANSITTQIRPLRMQAPITTNIQ